MGAGNRHPSETRQRECPNGGGRDLQVDGRATGLESSWPSLEQEGGLQGDGDLSVSVVGGLTLLLNGLGTDQ